MANSDRISLIYFTMWLILQMICLENLMFSGLVRAKQQPNSRNLIITLKMNQIKRFSNTLSFHLMCTLFICVNLIYSSSFRCVPHYKASPVRLYNFKISKQMVTEARHSFEGCIYLGRGAGLAATLPCHWWHCYCYHCRCSWSWWSGVIFIGSVVLSLFLG